MLDNVSVNNPESTLHGSGWIVSDVQLESYIECT